MIRKLACMTLAVVMATSMFGCISVKRVHGCSHCCKQCQKERAYSESREINIEMEKTQTTPQSDK